MGKEKTKKAWLRRGLVAAAVVTAALLLLVLLLPALVSSGPGTRLALSLVNGSIAGRVSVDDLSVGWTHGATIRKLTLADARGQPVLTADEISAPGLTVGALLRGSRDVGTVQMVNPVATLSRDEAGRLNLAEALASTSPPKPKKPSPPNPKALEGLRADLQLVGGRVTFTAPGIEPLTVDDLNTTVTIPDLSTITADLAAQVAQGDTRGSVSVKATLRDALQASGALRLDTATVDAHAQVKDLPVAGVDRMLGQGGKLTALLGPIFNAQVLARGDLKNLASAVTARSEHLNLRLGLPIAGGAVSTDPDSILRLTVTPEAWRLLTADARGENATTLAAPFDVEFTPEQFAGKLRDDFTLDLMSIVTRGRLGVTDVTLDTATAGRITLTGTTGQVSFDAPQQSTLRASLQSVARQADRQGSVSLSVNLKNTLTSAGALNRQGVTGEVKGSIQRWPLVILDELAATGGLAQTALGPMLDATIDADLQPTADGQAITGTFELTAAAQNLTDTRLAGTVGAAGVTIESGSGLKLRLTQALVSRLLQNAGELAGAALRNPVTLHVNIHQADFPLGETAAGGSIHAAATLDGAMATLSPRLGTVTLTDTALTIKSDDLSHKIDTTLTTRVESPPEATHDGGLIRLATGSPAVVTLTASSARASALAHHFLATIRSDLTTAALEGDLTAEALTLKPGGQLSVTAHPELVSALAPTVRLSQPARIVATLGAVHQPRGHGVEVSQTSLGLTATIDQVALADYPDVGLRDVSLSLPQAQLAGPIKPSLTGRFVSRQGDGSLKVDADVSNPLDSGALAGTVTVVLTDVPVALVDGLMDQGGTLVDWLGARLDRVDAGATMAPGKPVTFHAKVKSPALRTNVAGAYDRDKRRVVVNKGGTVEYDLGPQVFSLRGADGSRVQGVELLKPARWRVDLDALDVTLRPPPEGPRGLEPQARPLPVLPDQTTVKLRVSADEVALRYEDTGQEVRLSNLGVAADVPSLTKTTTLTVSSKISAVGAGIDPGAPQTFSSTTRLANLVDASGALDLKKLTLETDTQLASVPTALLGLVIHDADTRRAIGPTVTLSLRGALPGRLDADFKSRNINLAQPLSLNTDAQRHVTLLRDLVATVAINSETAAMLGKMSPALVDASDSRQPAVITVKREDFLLPLGSDQPLIKVARLDGSVELGTLTLNQSWLIKEYAGWVGSLGAGFGKALGAGSQGTRIILGIVGEVTDQKNTLQDLTRGIDQVNAYANRIERLTNQPTDYQFTPLLFSVKDGVVHTEDVWMTSPDLALGVRGKVDFHDERLDMKLGIPGRVLSMTIPVVGQTGLIDAAKIYEMPIKGPIGTRQVARKDKDSSLQGLLNLAPKIIERLALGTQPTRAAPGQAQLGADWRHMPDWPPPGTKLPQAQPQEVQQQPAQQQPVQQQPQQQQPKEQSPVDLLEQLLRDSTQKKKAK